MLGIIHSERGAYMPLNGMKTEVRVHNKTLQFWDWYCSQWVDTTTDKIDIVEGQIEVFVFEGCTFLGNLKEALNKYNEIKPSKKVFIWLQDNYPQLKLITK